MFEFSIRYVYEELFIALTRNPQPFPNATAHLSPNRVVIPKRLHKPTLISLTSDSVTTKTLEKLLAPNAPLSAPIFSLSLVKSLHQTISALRSVSSLGPALARCRSGELFAPHQSSDSLKVLSSLSPEFGLKVSAASFDHSMFSKPKTATLSPISNR